MGLILSLVRRYLLRNELYDDQPDRHPALKSCQKGETVPFKGTNWRVADIREKPIPALILVPVGETRASKVHAVRKLRRADRILTKQEHAASASLNRRAD